MSEVADRWRRFWFDPEPASNLGLCRALFYALVLLRYVFNDVSAWGELSQSFWFPTPFFEKLGVPALNPTLLLAADIVWKLALLSSALGLATRPAMAVAFAIGLYRLGLPHNFGKVHHFDAMLVFVFGVLALSRAGDAWSLDRLFAVRRGTASTVVPSGEYRWPVRAVWVILSVTFFAAGVSKLRHGGLAWIFSDNMAILLGQHAYQVANADPPVSWGLWLSRYPALCSVMAGATVVVEVGYPLSLISRHARWFFPPSMCMALVGIRLLMGPTFPEFIICHLFWIPWNRAFETLGSKLQRRARPAVPAVAAAK